MERDKNFRPLTDDELALRQARSVKRLAELGISQLDNAKVLLGATILIVENDDGETELALLDPSKGTDQRIINQLPVRRAPRDASYPRIFES